MTYPTHSRRLQQYYVPKNTSPVASPEASPSPELTPQINSASPWGGGVGLNYGSRVGFAAGAAVGIIILICIFILVCDRRRRPYISSAVHHPLGNRHLYTAQPAPNVPKQVQFPVIIVNPDNEVECGRKIFLDRTPSSKQDPDNYFTSIGPGPPLFEANVPFRASSGALLTQSGLLQAPSGTLRSFKQRFRPSSELTQNNQGATSSFDVEQSIAPVPLHTSDGVVPGGVMPVMTNNPLATEGAAAPASSRSFFRSPFADWNPATGIANDSNPASVEMARSRSGLRRLRSNSGNMG
ncbi:TPA: hypothetical protein ACH3X3_005417 [Trebouxia sp. C0006]